MASEATGPRRRERLILERQTLIVVRGCDLAQDARSPGPLPCYNLSLRFPFGVRLMVWSEDSLSVIYRI